MDKRWQLNRVLQIKEMRRKLAEIEAARAARLRHEAEAAVSNAYAEQNEIIENSDQRRNARLEKLLEDGRNPAVENARIRNLYRATDHEIDASKFRTDCRISELEIAETSAKMKQKELASFLQREERTRKLCERLTELKIQEDLRHE